MEGYAQSTEYTTAAAGLLAILHDKVDYGLSQEHELDVWRASVNLPTRASSIFGLAVFAKQQGLSPRIVVDSLAYDYPDYRFNRYTKKDFELAQVMHDAHVQRAEQLEVPIAVRELSFIEIKRLILEGRTLLVRLNEGVLRGAGSTSKYVVVFGYVDGDFLVLDPVQEQPLVRVNEAALREGFDTLSTKKKRGHRMIVF